MTNPAFEGAEINGKQFPFIRVTIASQKRIADKFMPSRLSLFLDRHFPERLIFRMWKRVRSVAFVKDWKWKYFRIIPKELRCSEIGLKSVGEIQASFFVYVAETVSAYNLLSSSAMTGQTKSASEKSGV